MSEKRPDSLTLPLDAIVLDLDDTIFDTTGILLPAADLRAIASLRRSGLLLSTDGALARIRELRAGGAAEPFAALSDEYGLAQSAATDAARAFFCYEVPAIALDADVVVALNRLRDLAPLCLLTTGDEATQRAKAEQLGLDAFFTVREFVPLGSAGGKVAALDRLLTKHGWRPGRVVFAGDRLDGDVRAANRCGCVAVWVRRDGAEFAAMRPTSDDDRPWRTISHVRELPPLLEAQ